MKLDTIEELKAEVERCHERLEIDHCYESVPSRLIGSSSGMKKVVIPLNERLSWPDGIEARDCTIKIQDEIIKSLRKQLNEEEE